MNPDSDINVCAVYEDGSAVIYGHQRDDGVRPRIRSMQFPSYGAAKLWATEYEEGERIARLARRR